MAALAAAGACARGGTVAGAPASVSASTDHWVDSVLAGMSLRDRAAQLVWPQLFADYTPESSAGWRRVAGQITREHVGGFIMSIGSPIEMATKLNEMQRLSAVPLVIGADFETGAGFRARGGHFLPNGIYLGGATIFPPQMAIGAIGDTTLAYELGRITAVEGRALGVHIAFAPVLDVNNNPDNPVIGPRSFGEDPRLVAAMGRAAIRGIQEHGMLATAKHFPGHGDTDRNSHLAVTTVSVSRARLDTVELVPFRAAIAAGVGAVMTFHGIVPALDTTPVPATLSPVVMTELLRHQLGFNGLLVTDALDMNGVLANVRVDSTGHVLSGSYGAIGNSIGIAEATKRAFAAGADVLLMPSDVTAAIDAVVQGVAEGRFTAERLNASVRRILEIKHQLALDRQRFVDVSAVRRVVGDSANIAVAQQVAERSITLAFDSAGLVPLSAGSTRRILSVTIANRTDLDAGTAVNAELRRAGFDVRDATISGSDPLLDPARVVALADSADAIVIGWYLGASNTTSTLAAPPVADSVVRGLLARKRPTVLVSFADPYIVRQFAGIRAYVVAWGPFPVSQRAAALALTGAIPIGGHLPISIPPTLGRGAGIMRPATRH